jgi:hypothetical protein
MDKGMAQDPTAWPTSDFSRVPYAVFTDADIYQLENERIFRGPVWNYLCHEVELPEVGSFVTNWIGDTQVVVTRSEDHSFHAFENSPVELLPQRRTHGCAFAQGHEGQGRHARIFSKI